MQPMQQVQPVTIIVRFVVGSIDQALKVMESNREVLERLARSARAGGAIHHDFYTDVEGGALVALDVWQSLGDFDRFFNDNAEIQGLMAQAGVRSQPQITVLEPREVAGTF